MHCVKYASNERKTLNPLLERDSNTVLWSVYSLNYARYGKIYVVCGRLTKQILSAFNKCVGLHTFAMIRYLITV